MMKKFLSYFFSGCLVFPFLEGIWVINGWGSFLGKTGVIDNSLSYAATFTVVDYILITIGLYRTHLDECLYERSQFIKVMKMEMYQETYPDANLCLAEHEFYDRMEKDLLNDEKS